MEVYSMKISIKDIALVGLLTALAVVGRIMFNFIPSAQPSSFIIIITGITLGARYGFAVGALCALVSNMLLGQGPWTLFQMVAWSAMGFSASWFWRATKRNIYLLTAFGFVWGFIFGWFMNLQWVITQPQFSIITYLSSCFSSFEYDLMHALSNGALILVLTSKCIKVIKKAP